MAIITDHKWKHGPESWDNGRGECWQTVRITNDDPPPFYGPDETAKCGYLADDHAEIDDGIIPNR